MTTTAGTQSLYCIDCGARVRAAANFCGRCGTRQQPGRNEPPAKSRQRGGFGAAPAAVDATAVMARLPARPPSPAVRTGSPRTDFDAEPRAAVGALASRTARAGASFVDGVIVMGGLVPAGVLYAAGSVIAAVIAWLVAVSCYAPLTMARTGRANGQTLGKQLLGVRVVKQDGSRMTAGTAFKRELVGKALLTNVTLGLYWLMDCLWVLFDDRKQALHDKVGGTYVLCARADLRQAAVLTGLRSTVPVMARAPSPPPPSR